MRLRHQTDVAASPEDVWEFLQDTPAVVACLPGAELADELGDDRYQGMLKVAIGPLKMSYAGDVTVVERDTAARRMVFNASGRDKRGAGTVQANVRLQVEPSADGSRLDVVSDIDLTGRIASLGRGIHDVSNQMFVQFAARLGSQVDGSPVTRGPEAGGLSASQAIGSPGVLTTNGERPGSTPPSAAPTGARDLGSEVKVFPLLWSVTRTRLADFLTRLSDRVRPD